MSNLIYNPNWIYHAIVGDYNFKKFSSIIKSGFIKPKRELGYNINSRFNGFNGFDYISACTYEMCENLDILYNASDDLYAYPFDIESWDNNLNNSITLRYLYNIVKSGRYARNIPAYYEYICNNISFIISEDIYFEKCVLVPRSPYIYSYLEQKYIDDIYYNELVRMSDLIGEVQTKYLIPIYSVIAVLLPENVSIKVDEVKKILYENECDLPIIKEINHIKGYVKTL